MNSSEASWCSIVERYSEVNKRPITDQDHRMAWCRKILCMRDNIGVGRVIFMEEKIIISETSIPKTLLFELYDRNELHTDRSCEDVKVP